MGDNVQMKKNSKPSEKENRNEILLADGVKRTSKSANMREYITAVGR
jgi:hypothetical protein